MAQVQSGGKVPTNAPNQGAQSNLQNRANILMYGVERLQQIYSTATNPANQTIVNVNPQNVGLVRGFLVKIEGTIANTNTGASGVALSRTNFGVANLLRNIVFTDINNQVRHQTQGWHLNLINSAKQPMVMGGAYTPNVPVGYGSNYDVMTGPSSISVATGSSAVQMYYYVPLSYSKVDLRGAMWAGVVNAVSQLQLEINPNPVVASGDAGLAVYKGNTGGWTGNVNITIWQDYIDQVPMDKSGNPFLPQDDIATLYQLNNTTLSALVAGQDFGIPFANFRNFLSTSLVYDNAGTYNAGTDINYFALQTANSSNIWKYGPEEAAFLARSTFMGDVPTGSYYFDHRAKPISTQQFGNTQITLNPSSVSNGASVWAGFEYFSQASQVVFAGSLPSGG
jgi:hypothetical protein